MEAIGYLFDDHRFFGRGCYEDLPDSEMPPMEERTPVLDTDEWFEPEAQPCSGCGLLAEPGGCAGGLASMRDKTAHDLVKLLDGYFLCGGSYPVPNDFRERMSKRAVRRLGGNPSRAVTTQPHPAVAQLDPYRSGIQPVIPVKP